MKITGTALIAALFVIAAFFAMPLSAQTAKQKAQDINAAGQAAGQSQSATDARSINNAAWDGSQGGQTSGFAGKQVILLGGNAPDGQKEEESSVPDASESEDETPWKGEMEAIKGLLGAVIAALAIAAIFLDTDKMSSCVIGTVFCGIAIAASVAMIALAMVLMIKYKQAAMGGIWLAAGTALLGLSIFALVAGIRNGKRIKQGTDEAKAALESSNKMLQKFLGLIGVGGGVMDGYADKINEKTEKKEDKKDEKKDGGSGNENK